ncbi:hypothetical protein QFC20_006916 [Naganishia adeliensis]|uniref:Uncharacterized protein n=1 Tax=Naganishia adeliensis TaxID=92952 RepID=A0ACC2V5G5_9TREE|nr:hypothetical protein QFC20_006916 [Naganishia adeliensis]
MSVRKILAFATLNERAVQQDVMGEQRKPGFSILDASEEEVNAIASGGREYRLYIQKVTRTEKLTPPKPPPIPVTTVPPTSPKGSKPSSTTSENITTTQSGLEAYESLNEANQRAREYFLYEVIFANEEEEDDPLDECNRDSRTLPYSVTSSNDDTDEIFIEVKALRFFPSSRPVRQQQPPAPPPIAQQRPSGSVKRPAPPAGPVQPVHRRPRVAQPNDDDDEMVCLS